MIMSIFWKILGLGLAIPCTLVCILNLYTKAKAGEQYELEILRLSTFYVVGLIGWAITFGIH